MALYSVGMNINQALSDPTVVANITQVIQQNPQLSRTALSRMICEKYDWRSPTGTLQEMGCRVSLNKLEKEGKIVLPPARKKVRPVKHRRRCLLKHKLQQPTTIMVPLKELGELSLVRVTRETPLLSQQWRELTARYHYLGSGPLCGRQLRYFVKSERFNWLGTLAFTSAALNLAARDKWISWDRTAQSLHLGQVVCNARFLIFPWVVVGNLASKILGLCVDQVRRDWLDTYGVDPVLMETFVAPRFKGTCYRAAGWELVGKTSGRGRQDQYLEFNVSRKKIFLLPLVKNFREILTWRPPIKPEPVYYQDAVTDAAWAEQEFGTAELGDKRLTRRLVLLAEKFFCKPISNIPEACGSKAASRSAYHFFRHPQLTMQNILAPHYESTAGRIRAEGGVILTVQDTTFLNYSSHRATEDLGPIGSREDGPVGLVLHDTLAFTAAGTPLGLVNVQCWNRDSNDFGRDKRQLPIEEKESIKWIRSWEASCQLQERIPEAQIVSVGDREADLYELFERADMREKGAKILLRLQHNRKLSGQSIRLKEEIYNRPVIHQIQVSVPRRGRHKKRLVTMNLRYGTVKLSPPGKMQGRRHLSLQFVHVVESSPAAKSAIEWFLLTDCAVESLAQAQEILRWYTQRWGIEVYHRIIKSGCRIQDRQLRAASRLENCLAIDLVVAWRVFLLTMLGREFPDLPADTCMSEIEWKLLAKKYTGKVPEKTPGIRDAMLWVSFLGGYIGHVKTTLPGPTVIWRGLTTLKNMVEGYELFQSLMPAGP